MHLHDLQAKLPWAIPYSPAFVDSQQEEKHRHLMHDVLHVQKSLGKIAATCERIDHRLCMGLDGTERDMLAAEVVDLVICALHMANTNPFGRFDLETAVLAALDRRNGSNLLEEDGYSSDSPETDDPVQDIYYVHRSPQGVVLVKAAEFFIKQGGLEKPWGRNWTKLVARSIQEARAQGALLLPTKGIVS